MRRLSVFAAPTHCVLRTTVRMRTTHEPPFTDFTFTSGLSPDITHCVVAPGTSREPSSLHRRLHELIRQPV